MVISSSVRVDKQSSDIAGGVHLDKLSNIDDALEHENSMSHVDTGRGESEGLMNDACRKNEKQPGIRPWDS